MHSGQRASLPVQVEAVTEEELSSAMDMDWDEELKQLTIKLRPKVLFLRKNNYIDERMFDKLLRMQGIVHRLSLLTKLLMLPYIVLTTVLAPSYIAITEATSHSSTPNFHIAHCVTSLGILSKAFSESTKPKYDFLPLALYFCSCLAVNIAAVA